MHLHSTICFHPLVGDLGDLQVNSDQWLHQEDSYQPKTLSPGESTIFSNVTEMS